MSDITLPPTFAKSATSFVGRFKLPLVAFLLSRIWVALFVYLGHMQHPYLSPVPGGWEGVENWWLNPWTTYDSKHLLDIAQNGYQIHNAAFFPLYPLLLSLAGNDRIVLAAWGTILSNLAFCGALLIVYRLTQTEYSESVARITIWLLAFFPTTVIFSAVYTESIFLFFIVGAFFLWRKHSWLWATVLFALAGLTRNSGPILTFALFVEWLWRRREYSPHERWWALFPVCAPLLGFITFQFYLHHATGVWMASLVGQKYFGTGSRTADWPWLSLWSDYQLLVSSNGFNLLVFLNVIACLLAFIFLLRSGKPQPSAYSVWLAGIILLHLTYAPAREVKTVDALRYLSSTYPFTQALAFNLQFLCAKRARLILGFILLLLISAALCYSFSQKAYIS